MPHAHRKTDEDTDLGLPRKVVSKAVKGLFTLVCAGLVWFGNHINQKLDRLGDVTSETNVRVARIEGKLNIVADATPKVVAKAP